MCENVQRDARFQEHGGLRQHELVLRRCEEAAGGLCPEEAHGGGARGEGRRDAQRGGGERGCGCLRRGLSVEDVLEPGVLARSGRSGGARPRAPWVGGGVRLRPPSQGAVSCPVPRGARAGSSCATRSLVLGIWSPNLRR